ncbi:RDD family protein [Luteitalea sp.]|uniref:RDD family protein n=1 Tax=Luteitalea sp. TaxID=2004800 RepID=UPI0025C54D80|nr:RDD family protein [Luteitalea sp.]
MGTYDAAPAVTPASLSARFGAYFFDSLLITLVVAGVYYSVVGADQAFAQFFRPAPEDEALRLRFYAERSIIRNVAMALYLGYATVAEASPLGGTLGKWLLSIKVVDMAGQRLDLRRSMLRNAGKLISLLSVVGPLFALRSPIRQTWHDRWSSTRVIHVHVP